MTEGSQKIKQKIGLRGKIRRKKPKFVRSESWRYVRIKENWRRPRGLDHKMRIKYRGWPPSVGAGYRGPKATRGLHPSGYREILAHNVEALKGIDSKTQVVRIAHTVGKRKKARILTEARKKNIVILNVKEALPREGKLAEETSEQEDVKTERGTSSKPMAEPEETRKSTEETKQR
jgi:large subunit ribosomal protein L32e